MIQRSLNDDLLKGLLAFAPFYMIINTLSLGFSMGLIILTLILFLSFVIYFSRNLFTRPQQRIAFVLIVSISSFLLLRMLLNAEVFSLVEKIGLFFPLLLMNSFVLSTNESILLMSDFRSVMRHILKTGVILLLFFIILGLLRGLLNETIIFSSPAGYFFMFGFTYAAFNFYKSKGL